MAFIRFSELAKGSGGRVGSRKNYDMMISVRKVSKSKKYTLAFTIGSNPMKKARWQIGDRMDIEMDDSSLLWRMFRVPENGWALSKTRNKDNPTVAIVWREGMPNLQLGREYVDVLVDDDGICFDFPESLMQVDKIRPPKTG